MKPKASLILTVIILASYLMTSCSTVEHTVTPEPETVGTEVVETEVRETEATETEAAETEAPETEVPETDAVETKAAETEVPETETVETEPVETEAPPTEPPETMVVETVPPETTPPETAPTEIEFPASGDTLLYLQRILDTKDFDEGIRSAILSVYQRMDENYDRVYSYRKPRKEETLRRFCEDISTLDSARMVGEGDDYAELLAQHGYAGLTVDHAIYLKADALGTVESNLSHEIAHLGNQTVLTAVGNVGIRLGDVIKEGHSSRFADYVEVLARHDWEELAVCAADCGRSIHIDREIESGFYSPYHGYETLYEHLECLLGTVKLNELMDGEGDFILGMRDTLAAEFGEDAAEEFLCKFISCTMFMGANGIGEPWGAEGLPDAIGQRAEQNNVYLSHDSASLYLTLEERAEWLEEYLSSGGTDAEAYLDGMLGIYQEEFRLLRWRLNHYNYNSLLRDIRFEIAVDEAKLAAYNAYRECGNAYVWELYTAMEVSFADLMAARIRSVSDEWSREELQAVCRYVYDDVIINCMENGRSVTGEYFADTVSAAFGDGSAFE